MESSHAIRMLSFVFSTTVAAARAAAGIGNGGMGGGGGIVTCWQHTPGVGGAGGEKDGTLSPPPRVGIGGMMLGTQGNGIGPFPSPGRARNDFQATVVLAAGSVACDVARRLARAARAGATAGPKVQGPVELITPPGLARAVRRA